MKTRLNQTYRGVLNMFSMIKQPGSLWDFGFQVWRAFFLVAIAKELWYTFGDDKPGAEKNLSLVSFDLVLDGDSPRFKFVFLFVYIVIGFKK